MCETCCPYKICKDPELLKAKLNEHVRYVNAIQAILYFKKPIQFGVIFVLVNLLFFFIGYFHLSFFPTVALLALLYNLGKLLFSFIGDKIVDFLFPAEVPMGEATESNHIRSADEVAACISCCVPKCDGCPCHCNGGIPIKKIAIMAGLFVLFLLAGTFWLNFVIVNLALILPGVLLLPQVNPYVLKAKDAICPCKAKAE